MIGGTRAVFAAMNIGFRHVLAYRAEAALQLLGALLATGLGGALWTAASRGGPVAGLEGSALVSMVVLGWISVSFSNSQVHLEVSSRFRDGQIVADLLRPLSLQVLCYARDLGRALATLGLQTLPLLLVCVGIFHVPLPRDPAVWALFTAALLLAHLVHFGLGFLVGLAGLRLHDITGLSYLKTALVTAFSGAFIPLDLYGGWAGALVGRLPFRLLAWTPASLFLERGGAWPLLEASLLWGAGLWLAGAVGWRWVARSLTVQGG